MHGCESSRLIPPDHGVALRLYRQGFGDCFLIAFKGADGEPHYVLIDCGVLLARTKESSAPSGEADNRAWAAAETARKNEANKQVIKAIVKDIHAACGGKLDILAVTHEHWDHISGFQQAREEWALFQGDAIGEIWMAWTEDPRDTFAVSLNARLRTMVNALRATTLRLASVNPVQAEQVTNLLDLFWDGAEEAVEEAMGMNGTGQLGMAGEGALGVSTSRSLELLEALGRPIRYWGPDKPPLDLFRIPGRTGGVRAYFLGPPRDAEALEKEDSSLPGELYPKSIALTADTAFVAAALFGEGSDEAGVTRLLGSDKAKYRALWDASQPFLPRFNMLQSEPEDNPNSHAAINTAGAQAELSRRFREKYYGPLTEDSTHPEAWRRIEADWLGSAAELALKLDNATNNTSLALAIEFTDAKGERKVLLFPGDAQFGNWDSWYQHKWNRTGEDGSGASSEITISDLLARTVFYKVGHHGSHNATLMERGLERMTHPNLVAFVPVSEAASRDNGWMHIPLPRLMERLIIKTRGRVLRADSNYPSSTGSDGGRAPRPPSLTAEEWNDFTERVKVCPLYFEFIVS